MFILATTLLIYKLLSVDLNIDDIRAQMSINNGQEILLAFAWISEEELSLVKRFPEFFALDVTERTNVEKRSMFLVTGQDGNNKLFIVLHCFMPNAQMDSFNWIYDYAMPLLIGEETLLKNKATITDGENALYSPLVNQTEKLGPWQNSKHYRCTYHLFTQEWHKKVRCIQVSDAAHDVIEICRRWINSLITEVQHPYQFTHSVEKFGVYLSLNKVCIGNHAHQQISQIFFTSMMPIDVKWARCHRPLRFDLDQSTSSHTESMNHSLKETTSSTLAGMQLDTSSEAMLLHSKQLNDKREV